MLALASDGCQSLLRILVCDLYRGEVGFPVESHCRWIFWDCTLSVPALIRVGKYKKRRKKMSRERLTACEIYVHQIFFPALNVPAS